MFNLFYRLIYEFFQFRQYFEITSKYMKVGYFKFRKPFDFFPHPYDLGSPIGYWKGYDDNHFLLLIYKLKEENFDEYYNRHLSHTLENELGNEEKFFKVVWQMVEDRIHHFKNQNPFSRKHASHIASIEKLQQFQNYLSSIDQWNARPSHIIIAEKEELIRKKDSKIDELQKRLNELNEYEVVQKIFIDEGYVPIVINILKQMQKLTSPSGRPLLKCDFNSPYYKMVSKYFSDGGTDISWETVRNYYVERTEDVTSKGTKIKHKHEIFKIEKITKR